MDFCRLVPETHLKKIRAIDFIWGQRAYDTMWKSSTIRLTGHDKICEQMASLSNLRYFRYFIPNRVDSDFQDQTPKDNWEQVWLGPVDKLSQGHPTLRFVEFHVPVAYFRAFDTRGQEYFDFNPPSQYVHRTRQAFYREINGASLSKYLITDVW
jgi:hypothetical protein